MFKAKKTLHSFPLAFYLAAGSIIFSASSSYAVRLSTDTTWTGDYPILGRQFIFKGISNRSINIIDAQSSSLPASQIFNNNTSEVSLLFTGNLVPPGVSTDFQWEIEDYPDETFGYEIESTVVVSTPTGVEEVETGGFTVTSRTSSQSLSPLSAVLLQTIFEGVERNIFYQVPGDAFTISPLLSAGTITGNLSILPISEYLFSEEVRQLKFPPTKSFTVSPGESVTIGVVPEPSTIIGLFSVTSLGAFFKRKLKRN
ncbi:PEP-CTERM sorting domain-containing protein [Nostoc sp.]|uniref:PEP-CTERM sorting domain-containing protein n=1 Tax=Nostoc sp. TaxID=1180 RepID=UPI0035938557